jgi:hypothetical protein
MTEVRAGQIWKEVDPRKERFVRVADFGFARATVHIETVHNVDGKWFRAPGARLSLVLKERFNGKRGGYRLFKDIEGGEPVGAEPAPRPKSGGAGA